MRRLLSSIIALIAIMAGSLSAQTTVDNNKEKPVGVNISLWTNMATQPTDSVGSTCLNIGLMSSINRLNGMGINALGSVVRRDMNGVQITGISNLVGGRMRGIQIAGISNVNGNKLSGLSVAGLVGITGHNAEGVVFAGLTNIMGSNAKGIFAGGLLNIVGDNSAGMQFAGLANISGGTFSGINLSGILNIVGGDAKGLQLSGLANITGESMRGVQLSGLCNVAADTISGVQISPFNVASNAKGLQIGIVNYYKDSHKGLRLGLVNACPDTKVQLMLFGGNSTKLNVGARFKNKLFYTILGGGTHYLDFGDKFSAAMFYRAGLELPVYKKIFVSGDLGFQHIETFNNKNYGFPKSLYALQARINLECRITSKFGIFATGGYGDTRHYGGGSYDKGLILEGGLVLF